METDHVLELRQVRRQFGALAAVDGIYKLRLAISRQPSAVSRQPSVEPAEC